MNLSLSLMLGTSLSSGGGSGTPTITSSDGDPASLIDNEDGTFDVIIDGENVGTITQAQINAGGFITVVEPEVGMDEDDVVLTTTGYVIHVGSTPIETDVEVLADGVAVGFALPFDATAYPDELLTVNFSYSVGGTPFVISLTAREAALKVIQFRDSFMDMSQAWPVGLRGRKAMVALRIIGVFNTATTNFVTLGPVVVQNNSATGLQVRPAGYTPTYLPVVAKNAASREISLLMSVDFDGGLPGGEGFTAWANIDGGTWARVGGYVPGSPPSVIALGPFGSQAAGNVGPNFDVANHIWMAGDALDPATAWPLFFNADGTVKDLGLTGVISGITPVIYMVGDDVPAGSNRGSGDDVTTFARTPITVVSA